MKTIVLLSGGIDSTTLLYYVRQHTINVKALSFDYNSKHNKKEIHFARYHCKKLDIEHHIIKLPFINQLFESTLLKKGGKIPNGHYTSKTMKSTVVPFRNGIMLSIAVGYAESNKFDTVSIASHSGDHAIYPDCRPLFNYYFNHAIIKGTYNKIYLSTPFQDKTKKEIVEIGKQLNIDYNKTWSCYKGNDKPCGKCGTCVEREEALYG